MREIDAFFDELNPDIKVIWGLSDDDSLDEDAKVTILATGLNNEIAEEVPGNSTISKDEEDYQRIIDKLYHPIRDSFKAREDKTIQKENIDNNHLDNTKKESKDEDFKAEAVEEMTKVSIKDNSHPTNVSEETSEKPSETKPKPLTMKGRIKNGLIKIAKDLEIITYDEENYK